jgi:hypothetical protein
LVIAVSRSVSRFRAGGGRAIGEEERLLLTNSAGGNRTIARE